MGLHPPPRDNRQQSILQLDFGGLINMGPIAAGPNAPIQGRVNWQQIFDQGFQANKLNDCRIMVVNVGVKIWRCPWQLDLLHLHNRAQTGKEGLNRTFKPGTINICRIMEVQLIMGHSCHLSSLLHNRKCMLQRRGDMRLQRQMDHDCEALQHQAHLAEQHRQWEHQRQLEQQHPANLAELQTGATKRGGARPSSGPKEWGIYIT